MDPMNLVIHIASLAIIFYLMAHVCDHAMEPCMEELADRFHLPLDVACATFLAAGGAAIEITITSIATATLNTEELDLSLGTVFGSVLLSFTLIPALCVLASPGKTLQLSIIPLLRDSVFVLIGLAALIWVIRDGEVSTEESIMLLMIYVIYIVVMFALTPYYESSSSSTTATTAPIHTQPIQTTSTTYGTGFETTTATQPLPLLSSSDDENDNNGTTKQSKSSWLSFSTLLYLVPPFHLKREKDVKKHWFGILIATLITLTILSRTCMMLTISLAQYLHISENVVGVILVAIGSQVDDAMASVALSKKGRGPSSIANALGSDMVTMLVAIGLPFLISNLVRHHAVPVAHYAAAHRLAIALSVVVIIFLACTGIGWRLNNFGMMWPQAMILTVTYAMFAIYLINPT